MPDTAELAQVAAGGLAAAGSTVLFGVPGGGVNLDVIGAAEAAGLRFVLTHGESAAAIMAGVYAELTGTPGACVMCLPFRHIRPRAPSPIRLRRQPG